MVERRTVQVKVGPAVESKLEKIDDPFFIAWLIRTDIVFLIQSKKRSVLAASLILLLENENIDWIESVYI